MRRKLGFGLIAAVILIIPAMAPFLVGYNHRVGFIMNASMAELQIPSKKTERTLCPRPNPLNPLIRIPEACPQDLDYYQDYRGRIDYDRTAYYFRVIREPIIRVPLGIASVPLIAAVLGGIWLLVFPAHKQPEESV